MNYSTALSGEYGPLWRELFATRDLKVWNDARIVHDLYVEGEIHSEGFAVPQVSFDHSKVKYDLVITGEGLDPERDIALLVENGIVNIKDNLAVEDTIGCGQIVQINGNVTNEFQGNILCEGDLAVNGTIIHTGKFNPPIVASLPSVGKFDRLGVGIDADPQSALRVAGQLML